MILVIQAIGLVRLISEYDIIFTMLGGEYKAAQNRFRELGVLPISFMVRTSWKYKNIQVLMTLKLRLLGV